MTDQEPDLLDRGLKGRLQPQCLLLMIMVTCCSSSRYHQVMVGVSPHDRLVLPLAVPLAGTNNRDVHNGSLGLELDVVGANQIHPLPSPAHYVEQPEKGD
jgi:hypothetical protein